MCPTYRMKDKSDDGSYDFHNLTLTYFKYYHNDHYSNKRYLEYVENINLCNKAMDDPNSIVKTITEKLEYGFLTLNPDGTIRFYEINSSNDTSGVYDWDSVFECTGKWVYDPNTRLMKISYENFKADANGRKFNED